jgi:hypothetical protein
MTKLLIYDPDSAQYHEPWTINYSSATHETLVCYSHAYYDDQIKKNEVYRACSMHERNVKCIQNFSSYLLVLRSRMRGALPLTHHYIFMAWCLVKHREPERRKLPGNLSMDKTMIWKWILRKLGVRMWTCSSGSRQGPVAVTTVLNLWITLKAGSWPAEWLLASQNGLYFM